MLPFQVKSVIPFSEPFTVDLENPPQEKDYDIYFKDLKDGITGKELLEQSPVPVWCEWQVRSNISFRIDMFSFSFLSNEALAYTVGSIPVLFPQLLPTHLWLEPATRRLEFPTITTSIGLFRWGKS